MHLELHQRTPCAERAGFLFRHACPYDAVSSCDACGKNVCQDHVQQVDPAELTTLANRGADVRATGRAEVCLACAKRLGENERSSVHRNRDDDDPYWYSHSYYPGYYLYGPGHWGSAFGSHDASHDRNDFTEADGSALRADGDDAFEHDASGS